MNSPSAEAVNVSWARVSDTVQCPTMGSARPMAGLRSDSARVEGVAADELHDDPAPPTDETASRWRSP